MGRQCGGWGPISVASRRKGLVGADGAVRWTMHLVRLQSEGLLVGPLDHAFPRRVCLWLALS